MKRQSPCVIAGLVLAIAAVSFDALAQTLPDTAANRRRGVVGCTQTRSGIVCPGAPSGGGGSGYSGGTAAFNMGMSLGNAMWQAFEAMERQAHQQRMTMARNFNDQGVALYNNGDYQGALAAFRDGLQYSPGSPTLLGNIQETEERLAEQRAEADRQMRAQMAAAQERISAMLGGLAEDVARRNAELTAAADLSFVAPAGTSFFGLGGGPGGAAPPSGEGLAFVGPGESLFSRGTKYSAPVDLREGASDQLASSRPAGSDKGGRSTEGGGGLKFVGPDESLKATVEPPPKTAARPPAAREKIADTKLAARTDSGKAPAAKSAPVTDEERKARTEAARKPAAGGPTRETAREDVPSPRLGAAQESAWQKLKKGTYFGTGFGEESAQWYADRYAASDKWYDRARYGAGGLFSSLWTPDTYKETALTLGPEAVLMTGKWIAGAKFLRAGTALTPEAKLADQYSVLYPNMAKQYPGGPSALKHADELQAISKKYNVPFEIMGSRAETEFGKAVRANPALREHSLPGWRADKWHWKGDDVDIRFDKKTFDKLKISENHPMVKEIEGVFRRDSGGKSKLPVDLKYSELYPTQKSAEGLPRFCVRPDGCVVKPGWGTPGYKPNYGSEVLWGKTPPHAN